MLYKQSQKLGKDNTTDYYDPDCGTKTSISKYVKVSGPKYAIMNSSTNRFKNLKDVTPFAIYNIDQAHKSGIETWAKNNRRFYSSVFEKSPKRESSHEQVCVENTNQDLERAKSCDPNNLAQRIEASPLKYAQMRSNTQRFPNLYGKKGQSETQYNTDVLNKQSMYTKAMASRREFNEMTNKSKTTRSSVTFQQGTSEKLGPGTYNAKKPDQIQFSSSMSRKSLSSFVSQTGRRTFDQKDPTKNLGSTWTQDKDYQYWRRINVSIPHSKYQRPLYLPKELFDELKINVDNKVQSLQKPQKK